MINPAADGITHINIYSQGATELGRWLTNFAATSFTCEDGTFASIEGYWYWLSVPASNPQRDDLRKAYGVRAKVLGRELRGNDWDSSPDFVTKIKNAITIKINSSPKMKKALEECALPLKHYYVYGTKVHEDDKAAWVIQHLETFRKPQQLIRFAPSVFNTEEVEQIGHILANMKFRACPAFLGNFYFNMFTAGGQKVPAELRFACQRLADLIPSQRFNSVFIQDYPTGTFVTRHRDPRNNMGNTIIAPFGKFTGAESTCHMEDGSLFKYTAAPGDAVIQACTINGKQGPLHSVSQVTSGNRWAIILNSIDR